MSTGKLSFLNALIGSLYLSPVFRNVRYEWRGLCLHYILFYNALILAAGLFYVIAILQPIQQITAQIPDMRIIDGHLQLPDDMKSQTISIRTGRQINDLLLIDPSITQPDPAIHNMAAIVGADGIYQRKKDRYEFQAWDTLQAPPFSLSNDNLAQLGSWLRGWLKDNRWMLYTGFGIFGWTMILMLLFIYRSVQALCLGFFTWLAARMMRQPINYPTATRLTMVALTPLILCELALIILTGSGIPFIAYSIIAMIYLMMVLKRSHLSE